MSGSQIRLGQLIAPFGPGSLYTDRRGTPVVVCGLDHWFQRYTPESGWVDCDNRSEFELFEPRLSQLLHINRFCTPPDYRRVHFGNTAPPNAMLSLPALRFPRWYRNTKNGQLKRFNLTTTRTDNPEGGGRWKPVRFVSVCKSGHLNEFPWKLWLGCDCAGDGDLYLEDSGGSELSAIRVLCKSCPKGSDGARGATLASTTLIPADGETSAFENAGVSCPGDRPWLGEASSEPNCIESLVAALINQTNIYFPKTLSAILLPELIQEDDATKHLRDQIQSSQICGNAKTVWRMGPEMRDSAVSMIETDLSKLGVDADKGTIKDVLADLFDNPQKIPESAQPSLPESELLRFRRAEYTVLREEVDDPDHIDYLTVRSSPVPENLTLWFARVNLVERLRETRVFYGFDRLEPEIGDLTSMPEAAMEQLFGTAPTNPADQWLPAVKTFGEGIYIELSEDQIGRWTDANMPWLEGRLNPDFLARLHTEHLTLPPLTAISLDWAIRYLLVHSLSHVLINQLVFDAGYSSAALRERLYVSADVSAPMAGLLIYTAAGDSEGTLGGLVRLAQPERLAAVVGRALGRASWCSADPICSEEIGSQGRGMVNLAACHACLLLPETTCETINSGLDRALLVGTPENRDAGWMSELLADQYSLGEPASDSDQPAS